MGVKQCIRGPKCCNTEKGDDNMIRIRYTYREDIRRQPVEKREEALLKEKAL